MALTVGSRIQLVAPVGVYRYGNGSKEAKARFEAMYSQIGYSKEWAPRYELPTGTTGTVISIGAGSGVARIKITGHIVEVSSADLERRFIESQ